MGGLPKGWVNVSIDDITSDVSYGVTAKSNPVDGDLQLLRITDIQDNKVDWSTVPYCAYETKYESSRLKNDDIVVARTGATVGKSFLIESAVENSVYASYLIRLRLAKGTLPKYLASFLRTPSYWQQISEQKAGIGQPNVNGTKLKTLQLPLAPLPEQKRIVEKLDEVLAQVDAIKARLDGIPDLLKRFRQSVLASAVSGRLTGKSDEAWRESVLEEVSTFQNGFAFKSGWFNEAGDYQVIKLGNIKDDHLKLDAAPAYLDSEQAELHLKFKPNVGDLLLSMTGTKFKRDYGFCCLVTEELPILINQRVGRIIPNRDIVSPEFLHLFLRSQMFRNQFFSGETGGVNQGNVGSKHIMACTLKVPQMEEQVAIAEKAKVLFDFANCIEVQVKKAQARVDNLTQSILAKAFRGELVEQDPNDEPADKLLERIAKARAEAEALAKAAKKAEAAKKRATKA